MMDMGNIFNVYTDIRNPLVVPGGKFRKMCQKIRGKMNKEMIPADFDIMYLKATKKFESPQMDFFAFISAVEEIARKYLTGSLISNVEYIISLLRPEA
jgi:hypothetical protein